MSCTPECASSTRRCRRRVIRSEHGALKVLEGVKSHQILHKVVTFLRSESPRLQEVLCIIRERRKTMPRHHTPPQKPRTPPELELKNNFTVTAACVVCTFYSHSSFVPHFHHTFAGSKGYLSLVPQIDPLVTQPVITITEKAPTRTFSWLKAPTSAFTFNTQVKHYAKRT